jgi:hypothetical protein
MTVRTKQAATVLYAGAVAASGIWRHVQADCPQALWFGVIMGVIAVAGAVLLCLRKPLPGYLTTFLSVSFVGGWFTRRFLTHPTDGQSLRVILVLAACLIEVLILVLPVQRANHRITPPVVQASPDHDTSN